MNLSLQFDENKKFLLCGELVKFHLKVSSPDFTDDFVQEFIERIGATVEGLEITESSFVDRSVSSSSSSLSIKGKKMKSAESLSNLLKCAHDNRSKDSHSSHSSMSSIAAKRFNSLRRNQEKAFWKDDFIYIPLDIFIDPECISSSCKKASVNIKVSLNELVPIDSVIQNLYKFDDDSINYTHKLQKIGQTEVSFSILRPLEVSLMTQSLSSSQVIVQLIIEYDQEDFKGSLEIETVDLFISDTFGKSNYFKIDPISNCQVPIKFETCPQQNCLLFYLTLIEEIPLEDFGLRVELCGRLEQINCNVFLISFESSFPVSSLFPIFVPNNLKITSSKLVFNDSNNSIKLFEPFQVEIILQNYNEEIDSFTINIICELATGKHRNISSIINPIEEWFIMQESKKTSNVLLLSPIDSCLHLKLPFAGSKSLKLTFVPVKRGFFNLNDELKIKNVTMDEHLNYEPIIIKVE